MRNISVTNASNGASKDYYHTLAEGIILCSAFVVEVVLIAVGNLLTVVLFAFNRKLRRKSLFLVINMAFSDAMLGAVCLPLYVYLIVGPTFQLWENAYELQMRLDIFVHVLHTIFTHSSLIFAVFISFERFYAIYWPLKHRRLSVREYFIIILTTWFLAIIVCAVHNAEHYFHLGLSFYGWVLFPLVFLSAVCVLNIRLQNSPYFCVFKYARAVKGWKQRARLGRDARLARFARTRLLRHALPISLLILRKRPTVLQST